MKFFNSLKYRTRFKLGFVPVFSRYIFWDADAIFNKLRNDGVVQHIRSLRPSERRMLHFGFGREIRNAFLLWHPKNPHTMLKLEGLSDERQADSPFHPDNYSWSILRRLIVAADITESEISATIDASEDLMYSLMARADDSPETLEGIRVSVADLVWSEQWKLLDDVLEETIVYSPSPAKLKVLLEGIGGHSDKLTPVNYLRVAHRALGYGIKIHPK